MAILVLGGNGFIGGQAAMALEAAGLDVERGASSRYDLARLHRPDDWRPLVRGREAVVNAAGIFREAAGRRFEALHTLGPIALFEACAAEGVPVVQVSALGATADATTGFLRSKARADARLLSLDIPSLVLQPSLVFGTGGESSRAFLALAAAPLIVVPGGGGQRIQPVHVNDVASAIARAIAERRFPRDRVAAVGPRPLTLREYLGALHDQSAPGPPRFVAIPMGLVRIAARLRIGLLDTDALRMLEVGNVADPAPFSALLGRMPRGVETFIAPAERSAARWAAGAAAWAPVLRLAIAFMWIVAAVVSTGLFPREASDALLARVGVSGALATLALYGASALDLALGIATLGVRRRLLWTLQIALVLDYTVIITIFLPDQWLHPFGPVVKNLPILAAMMLMRSLEAR